MTTRESLKFYVDLLRPQRKLFLLAVIFACLKAAIESPLPKVVGYIIDRFSKGDLEWFSAHWRLVAGGAAVFLALYMPISFCRSYLPSLVAFRAFFSLRTRLFAHLHGLSADFFLRNKTGDLTSRLMTDIQSSSTAVISIATRVGFDIFIFVPSLIFMLRMSWILTTAILGYCLVQLFFIRRMMPEIHRRSKAVQDKLGEISSDATEKLNAIELVRSLAKERDVERHFESLNADHLFLSTELTKYSLRRTIMVSGPNEILPILIVLVAFPLARWGALSPGDVVAIILYTPIMTGPLFRLSDAMTQWALAMGALSRVTDIFKALPSVKDRADAAVLPRPAGSLSFQHVDFSYPSLTPGEPPAEVIRDFHLEIEPGQVVALVGPSGAGKTTVLQLLLRFYDVSAGIIRVDGRDIRHVTQASLRQAIGVVMQSPTVFSGSIRDNLRFVRPDAKEYLIWEALRFAQLEEFVRSLPQGLNTVLGERGVNLSGGQKQRLSIARTFLKDPAILVLDEATSALDAKSESAIQEALDRLMIQRTTIVIAHRLSTVRNADRILVLQNGRIIESGKHEELMARRSHYYDLVKTQTEFIGL